MPNGENFHTFRGYQLEYSKSGRLTSALEDYLEMVFRLCVKNNYARVGQLAELLNVKPPSASKMISRLASLGYVVYDRYEIIVLTDKGRELGAFLLKRHNCTERFLRLIGSANPLSEAELIEHALLPSTLDALETFIAFLEHYPDIRKSYEEFKKRNISAL